VAVRSTHEETDNATVAGHIHQISSRINGTVSDVQEYNQGVEKDRCLQFDPQDYQTAASKASLAVAQSGSGAL